MRPKATKTASGIVAPVLRLYFSMSSSHAKKSDHHAAKSPLTRTLG